MNAEAAEVVARAAAEIGAKVVHYSTDFVFDGEQERPYVESDPPSPLSVYARSKAEGDARVAAAAPRHFILRVGCVYGRGGRNFASTLLRRLKAGQPLRMDAERRASPTWVREVAAVSIAVATTDAYGLYHCTADGETTWFEFARQIAAQLALREARIEPVTASQALRRPPAGRAGPSSRTGACGRRGWTASDGGTKFCRAIWKKSARPAERDRRRFERAPTRRRCPGTTSPSRPVPARRRARPPAQLGSDLARSRRRSGGRGPGGR